MFEEECKNLDEIAMKYAQRLNLAERRSFGLSRIF
jgi:hypothetical protein